MAQLPPIPDRTEVLISRDNRLMNIGWILWLRRLARGINGSGQVVGGTSLSLQAASIASTPITPALSSGLFEVSYYARITRAATTSSSLTVTIRWTDGGVAQSIAGAAMTGNTTTTVQTARYLVRADAGTTINVQTTYASVGGTTMQYSLDVVVEECGQSVA